LIKTLSWQFQEDNDPKHTSNLAKNWKSKKNIPKIPWPSNSPDLSPIENLWGIMKVKVAEHQPKTLKALVTMIRRTWNNFSIDLAQALIQSMKQRIEACRMAKGDYTLY
jgi:transposase